MRTSGKSYARRIMEQPLFGGSADRPTAGDEEQSETGTEAPDGSLTDQPVDLFDPGAITSAQRTDPDLSLIHI